MSCCFGPTAHASPWSTLSGHVHLTVVNLGTDFGTSVEVLSGLTPSDRIVLNPADSLADGDVVTLSAQNDQGRVAMTGPRMRRASAWLGMPDGAAVAGGCAVGPDYHRPAAEVPPAWQPQLRGMKRRRATPRSRAIGGDCFRTHLNSLVERALASNQNLRVAAARLEQARDQVTVARSGSVSLRAACPRRRTAARLRRIARSPSTPSRTSPPYRIIFVLGPDGQL